MADKADCLFLYFKPSGKWAYEGRGVFPRTEDVNRDTIAAANGGSFPGITSRAADMIIVVVPDEDCSARFAYPRMLEALE